MKGLIALAFGALGFGVGEFVAMGLLPYFAHDFNRGRVRGDGLVALLCARL